MLVVVMKDTKLLASAEDKSVDPGVGQDLLLDREAAPFLLQNPPGTLIRNLLDDKNESAVLDSEHNRAVETKTGSDQKGACPCFARFI